MSDLHITVTRPIEPGCLILITKDQIDAEQVGEVMEELHRIAGHNRFMIMEVPEGGGIELHGPDDLTNALRQLAKEAASAKARPKPKPRTKREVPPV